MTVMRIRLLVALATLGASLVLAAPAAANTCQTADDLGPAPATVTGTVGVGQVSAWWSQTSSGARAITVQPADGGVDLFVHDGSCGAVPLCTSTNPATAADTCVVSQTGRLTIEVRVDVTAGLNANYVLTVQDTVPPCCAGQPIGTWTAKAPVTKPVARELHAMAYDPVSHRTMLYGGCINYTCVDDTWVWDGTSWTQLTPATHPSFCPSPGLVYDTARAQMVLFCGYDSSPGGLWSQIWTWDGTTWTDRTPSVRPSGRQRYVLAYDVARARVVLFGGQYNQGGILGDTWTWDGATWTQRSPATSPPVRAGAAMAYDAARGETVLFGGASGPGAPADTWTWDGTTWTQRFPATSPGARWASAMAYDAGRGEAVLYGGYDLNSGAHLDDTWSWNGTTWTRHVTLTSPPGRYVVSMAYDADRAETVLFGGEVSGPSDDTWVYQFRR